MKPCHHKGALKSAKEKLIASNFNDLFTNTRISTRTVHFPLQVLSFIAQETKYKRKAARFSLGENNFLPTTASAVYLARLKKNKYNSVQMKKKKHFFFTRYNCARLRTHFWQLRTYDLFHCMTT